MGIANKKAVGIYNKKRPSLSSFPICIKTLGADICFRSQIVEYTRGVPKTARNTVRNVKRTNSMYTYSFYAPYRRCCAALLKA